MNTIRRADRSDLSAIHRLQDITFRDRVFIEHLPSRTEFIEQTERNVLEGDEHYFVQVSEGSVVGFIRFLKKSHWEALVWGKWLNTLVYAGCIVAFEKLRFPDLIFAIRDDNKRMINLARKFGFRNVGREFICYRTSLFSPLKTTNLTQYEITAEEFVQKSEWMRKNSLPLVFDL